MLKSAKDKADKQLRQVLEIYKRQIKPDEELNSLNQVMIKNFRFHVIKDLVKEGISEHQRALFE